MPSKSDPVFNSQSCEPQTGSAPRYHDIDRLTSAEGLVTVFSQRRRDGVITVAMHRTFSTIDETTQQPIDVKTAFVPEMMMEAYVAHVLLTRDRLAVLKEMRARGELKFPDGGERRVRNPPG